MMNYIWGGMISFSIIYAIFTNNVNLITDTVFESTKQAVSFGITMLGIISLWSGLMNILSMTKISSHIISITSPIINFIFKGLDKKSKAYEYICMNFSSNLLGLGNASTPLGLKACEELNKKTLNKEYILKLILLNTASLQLIPSTIIGIRSMLGSSSPNGIILPIWICSFLSIIGGFLMYNFLTRKEL